MTVAGDVLVEALFQRVYGQVTVLDPNIRLGAVASDAQGDIYLAGEVTGPAVLGGQAVPYVSSAPPHGNPFVAKLTAANQLVWLSVADNSATGARGWVNRLAVDSVGRVAATFTGSGPPHLWQGLTASGTNGCTYFALHEADGGLTSFWGAPGSTIATSATATPNGFVIGGHFGSAISAGGKSASGPTAYLNNGYVIDIDETGGVRSVWPVAATQGSWVTNPQLLSRGTDAVLVGASSQGFMDLGCGTYAPSVPPRTWEQNYWAALSVRSPGGTCSAVTYLEAAADSSVFIERVSALGADLLMLLRFRGSMTGAGLALLSSAQPPFSAADVDEQHDMAIVRMDPAGAARWHSQIRPVLPNARSAVSWGSLGQLAVTEVAGSERLLVADLTNTSVTVGALATPCGRGVAAYDAFAYVFDAASGLPVWSGCWGGAGNMAPAASIAATPGGFLVGLHMESTGQVAGEALVPGGVPGTLRSAYFVLYPP